METNSVKVGTSPTEPHSSRSPDQSSPERLGQSLSNIDDETTSSLFGLVDESDYAVGAPRGGDLPEEKQACECIGSKSKRVLGKILMGLAALALVAAATAFTLGTMGIGPLALGSIAGIAWLGLAVGGTAAGVTGLGGLALGGATIAKCFTDGPEGSSARDLRTRAFGINERKDVTVRKDFATRDQQEIERVLPNRVTGLYNSGVDCGYNTTAQSMKAIAPQLLEHLDRRIERADSDQLVHELAQNKLDLIEQLGRLMAPGAEAVRKQLENVARRKSDNAIEREQVEEELRTIAHSLEQNPGSSERRRLQQEQQSKLQQLDRLASQSESLLREQRGLEQELDVFEKEAPDLLDQGEQLSENDLKRLLRLAAAYAPGSTGAERLEKQSLKRLVDQRAELFSEQKGPEDAGWEKDDYILKLMTFRQQFGDFVDSTEMLPFDCRALRNAMGELTSGWFHEDGAPRDGSGSAPRQVDANELRNEIFKAIGFTNVGISRRLEVYGDNETLLERREEKEGSSGSIELEISPQGVSSIQEALLQSGRTETLESSTKLELEDPRYDDHPQRGQLVKSGKKQVILDSLPPTLQFNLKRTTWNRERQRAERVDKAVTIDSNLSVRSERMDDAGRKVVTTATYKPVFIACHTGNAAKGHYYGYGYQEVGDEHRPLGSDQSFGDGDFRTSWFKYNDSTVKGIDWEKSDELLAMQRNAVGVTYVKVPGSEVETIEEFDVQPDLPDQL